MDALKLSFLLLLLLPSADYFVDAEGTIEKTIGKEPDFTPICTNTTQDIIVLIVCKIRTERSGGEECRLTYRYGHDFIHECDSRFTLTAENQTVFLHLSSLTPADSGTHTCECSKAVGTFIYHLNITVRDKNDKEEDFPCAWIIIIVVIIITLVILGFIHQRLRNQTESQRGHPNEESQEIEPYSTFIQRESGLYSTVKLHQVNADGLNPVT
ncbi:uncharacterized protein LOC112451305 isoform X2 [Kryptolebias marmoratus]|uniref:uncharacterized protein LOC112451305 isoform X2 n=1 Tax=Kryptolebias marmoratus TaxID=37003 RepID=UPI000D52F2C6|nr:uncharacterized protein LOC112451305 isoform X2 [Kryptolebias marmoratus]